MNDVTWQKTGSGKLRANTIDSTSIIIKQEGSRWRWLLTFPNGKSVAGTETSESKAKEAWLKPYHSWILQIWALGKSVTSGFLVPVD